MPEFTIPAGGSQNIDLPALYMLIDSVTAGLTVELSGRSDNLDFEFEVRGGGKITGLTEVVSHWVIKNPNGIAVDVVLKGGSVFYDENRIDGDVNAMTRPVNLTKDGVHYFMGHSLPAFAGSYNILLIWNIVLANKKIIINKLKVDAPGDEIELYYLDSKPVYFLEIYDVPNKDLSKPSLSGKFYKTASGVKTGTLLTTIPSEINKMATPVEYDNSPIIIPSDRGLAITTKSTDVDLSAYIEFLHEPN